MCIDFKRHSYGHHQKQDWNAEEKENGKELGAETAAAKVEVVRAYSRERAAADAADAAADDDDAAAAPAAAAARLVFDW